MVWLEACTEDLPIAFFSLRRLRPVTMMPEPERKGSLLELARTLVREMEGHPSEAVPDLLWMLDEELHQDWSFPRMVGAGLRPYDSQ